MRNNELNSWNADDPDKFDQIKGFIKKEYMKFQVGNVVQDDWTHIIRDNN